ncbi:MAG TPA: hypothetical protein VGR72_02865 [Candidatus Acidoferrales bacterium]|nr:hypothetical protein [Candidatus Acidoferrales bacterium]
MKHQMRIAGTIIAKIAAILTRACLAIALACAVAFAQASDQNNAAMIGQVTGEDVSVAGPSEAAQAGGSHSFQFAGGSTIVVHSGQARVEFTGGGELDVCGPAKFTVLASGEALTVALSFGRIHAKLDSSRPVTIYTPLITARPVAVMDQPRDFTLSLEPTTGAMCVLAARGAVQVQQQLSGETLIVPEPAEVSLAATPLGATPAAPGSCRCDFDENSAKAASPERVVSESTLPVGVATTLPANSPAASDSSATEKRDTQILPPDVGEKTDHPDLPAPALPPARPRESVPPPALPPANGPITRIIAPPLVYDAKPLPAPEGTISVATVLLAKAVVVEPEWIFHGAVAEPMKAVKPQRVSQTAPQQVPQDASKQSSNKNKKRKGFWARFHEFLFGRPSKKT